MPADQTTTDPVVAELRRLLEAATPGPWGWRGDDDGLVELRGHGPFGAYDGRVISAQRGEPCTATRSDGEVALTAEACDACKAKWAEMLEQGHTDMWEDYRCPKPENLATVWLKGEHAIEPANRWAVRERPYRSDVIDVDHPDARLIVDMRNALPWLLDELDRRDAAAAGLREAITDLNDELAAAEDRNIELERRRAALLEGMTRSDQAHERALTELQRLRPQPGAAERVESSLQHVYSVLGDRAPSDIDIEALTNGAPWWLDLRDAVDGLADELRRYTERAPTGHSDPAPTVPDGVDLSGMTQARRGGLAVLLAAHRAGAPVYRANTTTAPWEARTRAAAGQHLYLYRGISDWLGTRGLVELVRRGKDSVLQITDRGRQVAEYLEATGGGGA